MSYEGYVQMLCAKGHLHQDDCYSSEPEFCPVCESKFVFRLGVNQTNGIEHDNAGIPYPGTIDYPFEENGFEDVWHHDHYGTKFATKRILYKIPHQAR